MTDLSSPDFRKSAGAKRATPNIAGGWLVMILAFLIAMSVYFYLTQQQGQTFSIAVAAQEIQPGTKVNSGSFRSVQVNVPQNQLDKMLSFDEIDSVSGFVSTGVITSGDPILKSALRAAAASDGLRAMSIPNLSERSVGGSLVVGDRIDVIDMSQNVPGGYVARDLEVLAVNSAAGGGLSGSGSFSVTVAIGEGDASRISLAINTNQKFDIVRSTGASPLTFPETAATTATTAAP